MNGKRQIVVERTMVDSKARWSIVGARWQEMHRQVASGHASTRPFWANVSVRTKVSAALLAAMSLSGCGNIEPWVKPYERQALADPIMAFNANPVSTAYMDHVFEAREGARGALGSAGGGCGCN
jgi:hypothetical protein